MHLVTRCFTKGPETSWITTFRQCEETPKNTHMLLNSAASHDKMSLFYPCRAQGAQPGQRTFLVLQEDIRYVEKGHLICLKNWEQLFNITPGALHNKQQRSSNAQKLRKTLDCLPTVKSFRSHSIVLCVFFKSIREHLKSGRSSPARKTRTTIRFVRVINWSRS